MLAMKDAHIAALRGAVAALVRDLQYFSKKEGGEDRFDSLLQAKAVMRKTRPVPLDDGPWWEFCC